MLLFWCMSLTQLSEHEQNSSMFQETEELVWSNETLLLLQIFKIYLFTDNVLEWAILSKCSFTSYMTERDWIQMDNTPENSESSAGLDNYLLLLFQWFSSTDILLI